jgi:polygalacturonase
MLTTSGTIQANLMGAIPNDGLDDTKAIQDAIDQAAANGGGTVSLGDGDYNVNADTSIFLRSNVTLSMTGNANLIADTSSNERYAVIKAVNIHDARVLGGRIIGDRDYHNGTTGEWGYGIAIKGSDHIRVVNTRIGKCWGDGLIVGPAGGTPSTNITVKGVWSRNNRRQAISVIEVDGLLIDSCYLYNTNGTAPEDGIDIEPDVLSTPRTAQNITITNCYIYSNMGNGIEINARSGNIIRNVTMQYNTIYDHTQGFSGYFQNADSVTFSNNTMYGNKYNLPYHASCTNYVANNNTVQ